MVTQIVNAGIWCGRRINGLNAPQLRHVIIYDVQMIGSATTQNNQCRRVAIQNRWDAEQPGESLLLFERAQKQS